MTSSTPPIFSGDSRSLGRSLRTWRALRRIKQDHAARLLGVSQATVSRWENGQAPPAPDEALRLRSLLAARLDSPGDRVLARLVQQSAAPVHLVCDLTHRLLAASPAREAQFKVPTSQLLGASLWRCASAAIVDAEAGLADLGWFGPQPPVVEFHTGARESDDLRILACRMRWVRLQLSDGSFVRLVESLVDGLAESPDLPAHQAAPSGDGSAATPVNQAAPSGDGSAATPVNQAAPSGDGSAATPVNQAAPSGDGSAATPVNQSASAPSEAHSR